MESISVIVTTYFRNEMLENAIRSVQNQSGVTTSTYIIDMSGCEHARPVAEEFDVQYLPIRGYDTENKLEQVATARDIGKNVSDDPYIFFLDDDNVLVDGALHTLQDSLVTNAESGAACCVMDGLLTPRVVHPFFESDGPTPSEPVIRFTLTGLVAPFSITAMLVERSVLETIQPMRQLPHDDIGVILEILTTTTIATVGKRLVIMQDDHGLSESTDCHEGRMAIYTHYEDLYEEVPKEVRQYAKSEWSYLRGSMTLKHQYWSPSAIRHFFRYVSSNPDPTRYQYLLFLSSFFGVAGLNALNYLRQYYSRATSKLRQSG